MERQSGRAPVAEKAEELAGTAGQMARELTGTAKQEAAAVTQTAADEVREVVRAATEEGRHVVDEVRAVAREQAEHEAERLADAVRELATRARALLDGRPDEAGAVKDYLQRAVDGLESASQTMRERGATGLLQTVSALGRRKPGTFLAAAALAGFGVSRVARAVAEDGGAGSRSARSGARGPIPLDRPLATSPYTTDADGLAIDRGGPIPRAHDNRSV